MVTVVSEFYPDGRVGRREGIGEAFLKETDLGCVLKTAEEVVGTWEKHL